MSPLSCIARSEAARFTVALSTLSLVAILTLAGCEQSPAGLSDPTPGDTLSQLSGLGQAPQELHLPAPGDTTAARLKISALKVSDQWFDSRYLATLPYVLIPTGAAQCIVAPLIKPIIVHGIIVSASPVFLVNEAVTAEEWLYRWNGTQWTYQSGQTVVVNLGTKTSFLPVPDAALYASSGGYYRVMVRFTWWANGTTGWFQTAGKTYDFDAQSDYSAAISGPGWCKV